MISKYLYDINMKTHMGIGPMSKNCVDATIELAYEYDINMMLIASRRQIESMKLGGGYVNNWNTKTFAEYVKENDPKNKIVLARDHGGPWQHPIEFINCTSIEEAMESAKESFKEDIEAGFEIIHIDPVFNNKNEKPDINWILDKVFELYSYCYDVANNLNKKILIEIGTEEQSVYPAENPEVIREILEKISTFCDVKNLPKPIYIVVQTGTKVMGETNVGDFPKTHNEISTYIREHKIDKILQICEEFGILMKEHNADYLSDESLSMHPEIGFHAINVAPEFGVVETKKLISIMKEIDCYEELNRFIEICIQSNKWEKWVIGLNELENIEKTFLCGHYLFSDENVINLKNIVSEKYFKITGKILDEELKKAVKESVLRYLSKLKLLPNKE